MKRLYQVWVGVVMLGLISAGGCMSDQPQTNQGWTGRNTSARTDSGQVYGIPANPPAAVNASPAANGGHMMMINGARMYYQVVGHGQPLVLIHGYPLSHELFRKQSHGLSNEFKVVTMDLPGYGRSEATGNDATIATYAHAVLALMDHLHIQKAIIGGHSMGGPIVFQMYKQQPDRFAGLILIDTFAAKATIIGQHIWNGFAAQAKQKGVASLTAKFIPQLLTGQDRMSNPALVKELKKIINEASVNGAIAGGHALANRPGYEKLLSSIDVPTLIFVGLQDTVAPISIAKKMHKQIGGSKLVVLKGGSHAAILEQGDKANQDIRQWWASHRSMSARR